MYIYILILLDPVDIEVKKKEKMEKKRNGGEGTIRKVRARFLLGREA